MSWQLRRAKAAKRSRPLRGRLLKIRGLWRSSSVIRWPPCGFAVHLDVAKLNLTLSSELFTNRHWQFEFTSLRQVTQEGIKLPWEVSEYDGQAELCFDSVEEMNAAFNEPPFFLAEVHPDDATFIDMEGCKLMVVEEIQKVA
jgi:hypothetical protein